MSFLKRKKKKMKSQMKKKISCVNSIVFVFICCFFLSFFHWWDKPWDCLLFFIYDFSSCFRSIFETDFVSVRLSSMKFLELNWKSNESLSRKRISFWIVFSPTCDQSNSCDEFSIFFDDYSRSSIRSSERQSLVLIFDSSPFVSATTLNWIDSIFFDFC